MQQATHKDISASSSNPNANKYRIYLNQKLGEGQFGIVYKGAYAPNSNGNQKTEFAVKQISKQKLMTLHIDKEKIIERLVAEKNTWMQRYPNFDYIFCISSHPNIVKFIEFIETGSSCYLISEFCEGPNLETYINTKGKLEEQQAIPWIKGLLSALIFMHGKNIIHRDIKPANIILQGNVPKIIDFGFAKEIKYQQHSKHTVGIVSEGSPKYMAPELLEDRNDYDFKVDIWAMGWTFYELLYGVDPWNVKNIQGKVRSDELFDIIDEKPLKFQTKIAKISKNLEQLIEGMLEKDPDDRVDHKQLKQLMDKI